MRSKSSLLIATLLLSVACTTNPWDRAEVADPDGELTALLEDLEEARQDGDGVAEIEWEIRRLAVYCPRHVPTKMANALIAYRNTDRSLALQHLDGIFDIEPSHPEAAILRSKIAVEEGSIAYARKLLEQQIKFRPDHAGLHESLAGVLYLLQEYEPARETIDRAARLGAAEWRVAYHLGLIEEAMGNTPAAVRYYNDCLEVNPAWQPARSRLIGLEGRR
ncbi:MAG: hypothetical protein RL885_28720 [Planctomycetota bacterium]